VDVPPASRRIDLAAVRALAPPLLAVLLAFGVTGILIVAAGKNPLLAYWSLAHGAFGSWDRIAVGLNRATPYALTGVGIALCFRARVINIGGEGQLVRGTDLHVGVLIALAAVAVGHVALWRTPFGFRLRILGASAPAAAYAGISPARALMSVMLLSGGLAGLAGAIEVLGVHYRLIDGFAHGFGFNAVAIPVLGGP